MITDWSDDEDDFVYGPEFRSLLYTDSIVELEEPPSAHLRCRECGEICIQARRVFQVHREDYSILRIERIYSLFENPAAKRAPEVMPAKDIRGDSILIEFYCDVEHTWWLELGNHKGTVLSNLLLPMKRRRR